MDKHLPYIKQCLTLYRYDELSFIVHMFFIRKKKIFKNIITFSPISPQVTDVGESRPQFPVQHYLESLPENSPLGTVVFRARANHGDAGPAGRLTYSIFKPHGLGNIDPVTGELVTFVHFFFTSNVTQFFCFRIPCKHTNLFIFTG